jgi:class 3 adenylate cyclase
LALAGPIRTTTLLFTDIEGSTRLLREAGDDYGALLEHHRRVVREAFADHNGREINTQGDSFFAAFDSAREGACAAVAIQRALAGSEWPFGRRVRLRIGIDTGEPSIDGEYVGLVVHRAARICAAGNGGQVLLSSATRSVLGENEIPGTALLDLGNHFLRDFDDGEHLFQLLIDGLPADLRPPRSSQQPTVPGLHDDEVLNAVTAEATAAGPRSIEPSSARESRIMRVGQALPGVIWSPAVLLGIALVILGLVYTPWFLVASVGVLVVIAAVKARRRQGAGSIASRVFALEGVSADPEVVGLLHEIGFLLMTARERLRMVGEYLSDHNPGTIARELKWQRATASTAAAASKLDSLARQSEALVALTNRSTALREEIQRFEPQVHEIRDELFEIRLGHRSRDDLVSQLQSERTDLDVLLNGLRAQLTTAMRLETSVHAKTQRRQLGSRLRRRLRRYRAF